MNHGCLTAEERDQDGIPEGAMGESGMDEGNLKKILQNIRADDCHWFTHKPERFKFLLSMAFANDIV